MKTAMETAAAAVAAAVMAGKKKEQIPEMVNKLQTLFSPVDDLSVKAITKALRRTIKLTFLILTNSGDGHR